MVKVGIESNSSNSSNSNSSGYTIFSVDCNCLMRKFMQNMLKAEWLSPFLVIFCKHPRVSNTITCDQAFFFLTPSSRRGKRMPDRRLPTRKLAWHTRKSVRWVATIVSFYSVFCFVIYQLVICLRVVWQHLVVWHNFHCNFRRFCPRTQTNPSK